MIERPVAVGAGLMLLACLTVWGSRMMFPVPEQIGGTDYENFYEPVARRLLEGRGVVYADGTPAARYPPGYPIMVAAIFAAAAQLGVSEVLVFRAAAMVAIGAVAWLIYAVARTVWGSEAAIGAGLIWMTYPALLWLSAQRSSELVFAVFLYAGFAAYWLARQRPAHAQRFALLAGLFTGAAMLTRPIAIGLGVLLAARLMTGRDDEPAPGRGVSNWRLACVLMLGTSLVVLPWEIWVYSRTGQIVPLSTNGAASARDGLTFGISDKGFRQGIAVPEDVAEVMRGVRARYRELHSAGEIGALLAGELRERPAAVVKLFLIKAARAWYATDAQRFERPLATLQAIYLALIAWATWAAWHSGPLARRLVVDVWLLVVYFWAMTTLTLSIARYMVPAMGLLFLLTPALLQRSRAWMRATYVPA